LTLLSHHELVAIDEVSRLRLLLAGELRLEIGRLAIRPFDFRRDLRVEDDPVHEPNEDEHDGAEPDLGGQREASQ
jgi:hypothetical protein